MTWLMRTEERTLAEVVPAPLPVVRDFYVDLHSIGLVHPLVASVRTIARTDMPDGYVQTYRIHDRIPLGPFTLRTRYTARMTVPRTGEVNAEARQFPMVRLDSVVAFDPVDEDTRVVENIRITAPRVLAGMTVREAVAAHTEMLANIRRHFAA